MFCTAAIARTINWYVDGSVYQTTTCNSGDNVTPPTPPAKYGYTFQGWNGSYIPVEYIESTGTQYIDFTNAVNIGTSITQIESIARLSLSQNTNNRQFLFSIGNGRVAHYVEVAGNGNFGLGGGATGTPVLCEVDQIYEITHTINGSSNSLLYIDGVLSLTITQYQSATNISPKTLLKLDGNVTPYVRIYSYQLYDNNVLKLNLIPVLDINGTPCLYDKVSNTFFYNAGTGQFIAGPVVSE